MIGASLNHVSCKKAAFERGLCTNIRVDYVEMIYKSLWQVYSPRVQRLNGLLERKWEKVGFLFAYWLNVRVETSCPVKIYHHHHHHHRVMPPARISLTLSRHFSLSFIASGRSSGLLLVSSHSCCMYVLAGRPVLARPYVGVHRSISLMSSSLLLCKLLYFLTSESSFVCAQLNGLKYCYLILKFCLLLIIYLQKVKRFQVLLFNISNSVYQYSN